VARNEDGSLNGCDQPALPGSILTFYLNGIGATTPTVQLASPASGTILALEQDPGSASGVWRLRIQLGPKATSGTVEPLIDGLTLREPWLGYWVSQ
jgi:uncharacterized protein (TIGR03437 family)